MKIQETYRLIIFPLILLFGMVACIQESEPAGKKLAEQYCQSCHLMPEPQTLSQSIWEKHVLPLMAARLGQPAGEYAEKEQLKELGLLPQASAMSPEEWLQLSRYYIDQAPISPLASEEILPIKTELKHFEPNKIAFPNEIPFTSLISWDKTQQSLIYGNATNKSLNIIDWKANDKESIPMSGAPSFIHPGQNGYYVLTMGKVMPHHDKIGALSFLPIQANGSLGPPTILLDSLARPVHASFDDLDGDGKEDMVLSNFGYYLGELIWYSDIKGPEPQKQILKPLPGAVKTTIDDFNGDGLPDILALMTQGDEQFLLFLNQGNGQFREKTLLRFPPSNGSTYFQWVDFDQDGRKDILYVNGDNGDYTPIIKNYHGLRLYRNLGNLEFEETFFLEQHGITKAIAEDFDQDGDLDLAAISYFPDYQNRPEESFVYYENTGKMDFRAASFEASPSGKWLTMHVADFDQDGDQDIVLGSAFFMTNEVPPDYRRNWQRDQTSLLILENKLVTQ